LTTSRTMDPVPTLLHLPLSQMLTLLEKLTLPSQQLVLCFSWVVVLFPGPPNCSLVLLARPRKQNSLLVSPAPGTWPSSTTILEDLGYKIMLPQPLGMDNQSAIRVAKNSQHQGCMRHLNPIYYTWKDKIDGNSPSFGVVITVTWPLLTISYISPHFCVPSGLQFVWERWLRFPLRVLFIPIAP